MQKVLLTGFAPFGASQANPSQQIAERLHGEIIGGAKVVGLTLPVRMGEDADRLTAAIADHGPALVLSLGLAKGATCLDVERFAVNLRFAGEVDASKPVEPNLPQSVIIADGMAGLFATVDAERVAAAIRENAGVPARAHGYAGAYACNHILYHALHYAMQWDLSYRAGFVHLPLSSEQTISENKLHLPSLPLDLMTAGIRAAIEEATS
jgi:pyroglutamyl-peptidase